MAPQLKSEEIVQITRPRFSIDGEAAPKLGEDLLRLEACSDEDGISRLEVVLLNWGRASADSEPGFVHFEEGTIDLGKTITVEAGADDNAAVIFKGVITSVEGVYSELRPPELLLRAEDALQWQRMSNRTRFFENASDVDMANEISGDYGISADAEAQGPTYKEFLQVNQSDLGFLRERARAVDARLAVEDDRLVFRPRRESDESPVELTRENELLRFHVAADLAHQRVEVRVHGYSVADKEAIHESAGADVVRQEAGGSGRTGPEILETLRAEAVEDLHLEAPADRDEARTLAESRMRRRARGFVRGRGVTSGTPAMRVGTRLDLVDLGTWFSGVYHVSQVRHTFDQTDGLRTYFVAERVDVGGAA